MVEIKLVSTKKELKEFIRFPHDLFRGNEYWVPPLDSDEMETLSKDKNPAFTLFQAFGFLMSSRAKRRISGT